MKPVHDRPSLLRFENVPPSVSFTTSRLFFSFLFFVHINKCVGTAIVSQPHSFIAWIQQVYFLYVSPFAVPLSLGIFVLLALFLSISVLSRRAVYLVDYICYNTPAILRVPPSTFLEHCTLSGCFNEKTLEFKRLIMERSGVGEETCVPEVMFYLPPRTNMASARKEAKMVIFGALESLFNGTKIQPKEVDILIVNCSLFTPVPSLSSMIVNRFKMKNNIKSYNLSGMGCSAGVTSVNLANSLLQVHRNSYALVVSTENITQNWYGGNRRSMVIPNCLFRVGAATVLLSNRRRDARRSKYRLQHVVRTITATDDKSYRCVFQQQDEDGNYGVTLSKDLTKVAGDALRSNITALGPLVLPLSELLAYVIVRVVKKFINPKTKAYVPNFKRAVDHFCIHAGGRAVIDELEHSLRLSPQQVEASRMSLHRFGNTSSSSIWYELSYLEAKGRVKSGHRVWQIAFGSGFKCNSCVWIALSRIGTRRGTARSNPWWECIHQYPVEIALPLA